MNPSHGQAVSVGRKLTRLCSMINVDFNDNPQGANDYPFWLLKALFDTVEEFDITLDKLMKKYLNNLETENN